MPDAAPDLETSCELVEFSYYTSQGNSPKENMDYGKPGIHPKGAFAIVADGMGGPGGGALASHAAVDAAYDILQSCSVLDVGSILAAITEANKAVNRAAQENPNLSAMGTTLVVALFTDEKVIVGHVGDSRATLYRSEYVKRLTSDHLSIVEEGMKMPDGSNLRVAENVAKNHKGSNVLSRALGSRDTFREDQIDIISEKTQPGDVLVLHSDGVSSFLNEQQISLILFESKCANPAEEIVLGAIRRQSHDHCTALVSKIL